MISVSCFSLFEWDVTTLEYGYDFIATEVLRALEVDVYDVNGADV